MELSAGFGKIGLLVGQGIVHLPTNLDGVLFLTTLDRPTANLFEIAATNIRAVGIEMTPSPSSNNQTWMTL